MTAPLITGPIYTDEGMLKFSFVYPAREGNDVVVFEWSCGIGYLPSKAWNGNNEFVKQTMRSPMSLPSVLGDRFIGDKKSIGINKWGYWIGRFNTLVKHVKIQFIEKMVKAPFLKPTEEDLLEALRSDIQFLVGMSTDEIVEDTKLWITLKKQNDKIIKVWGREFIQQALDNTEES